MSELSEILASLGLEQYLESLTNEGFDTWESVQDITERDLDALNFKLGHRRKLQRYIASQRGIQGDQPLTSPYSENTGDKAGEGGASPEGQTERPAAETKRKYRRHPKPDENAPERPPSAYVLFSNAIREEIKGQDLSFTDIAKLVGQRWQALSAAEREPFETRAANLKESFNQQLAEYKRSEQYRQYAHYLAEFRAKHGGGTAEGKRPKLEEEASAGSIGSPGPPASSSARSSELGDPSKPFSETAQASNVFHSPAYSLLRHSQGSAGTPLSQQSPRSSSVEGKGYGPMSLAEPSRSLTTHLRARERSPPPVRDEAAGYFDPYARHARVPSTSQSEQASSLDYAAQGSHNLQPPLTHQDTSTSSVPSTLSYGSASSGLPWTPQTPRDETWSTRSSVDISSTKGPLWDAPRPILPPFQSPAGHTYAGLQSLKMADRSFAHPTDPNLRLPPPTGHPASTAHEMLGLSSRTQPPPPPHFADQHKHASQRGESARDTPPGDRRREEAHGSPLDLLAKAVDSRRQDRERP